MFGVVAGSYFKHLQHFIAVVIDDFDGDFTGLGFVEWAAHFSGRSLFSRLFKISGT
jgi:hypothetical protein